MALREDFLENLVGDLEYHPRRAALYLSIGVATLCFWMFAPFDTKFTAIPLVVGAGSLTLILKGVFLLRKTSDGLGNSQQGLGLSEQEFVQSSRSFAPKPPPSIPALAAQMVQDFGTGAFLLGPVLEIGMRINDSWNNLPSFPVFLAGAAIFFIGWLIRRVTSSASDRS